MSPPPYISCSGTTYATVETEHGSVSRASEKRCEGGDRKKRCEGGDRKGRCDASEGTFRLARSPSALAVGTLRFFFLDEVSLWKGVPRTCRREKKKCQSLQGCNSACRSHPVCLPCGSHEGTLSTQIEFPPEPCDPQSDGRLSLLTFCLFRFGHFPPHNRLD